MLACNTVIYHNDATFVSLITHSLYSVMSDGMFLTFSMKMEPGVERPASALARGVQITEFKDARVNPEPIVLEETDLLLEQFLSPRKLVGTHWLTYHNIADVDDW